MLALGDGAQITGLDGVLEHMLHAFVHDTKLIDLKSGCKGTSYTAGFVYNHAVYVQMLLADQHPLLTAHTIPAGVAISDKWLPTSNWRAHGPRPISVPRLAVPQSGIGHATQPFLRLAQHLDETHCRPVAGT